VAIGTTLLFGLLPAFYAGRRDLVEGVKDGGRGSTGARHGWIRGGLVIAEVALSMVLLLGAGLLMRGFLALLNVDLGLSPANLVLATATFPDAGAGPRGAVWQSQYLQASSDRLRTVPGVVAVGASTAAPLDGWRQPFERPGRPARPSDVAQLTFCDDSFLAVLGTNPIRGRGLSDRDMATANHVAVVNQALVDRYFGSEDPIGRLAKLPALAKLPQPIADPSFEIVGIVPNLRDEGLHDPPSPALYVPLTVAGDSLLSRSEGLRPIRVAVRTAVDAAPLVDAITRALKAVDGRVVVIGVRTLEERLARLYAQPRFLVIVLGAFAITGLLLVAAGLYGLLAYIVSRRTAEIAVRMALGADRSRVLASVLTSGARLLVAGTFVGAVASLGTNALLTDWISEQPAFDPLMMAATIAVIASVGAAACLFPALRAARVETMEALRHE
jgi:predicted permease